jgi:hypothetical protein
MQFAINCVENWYRAVCLSVNADKTTMVSFTNNRKIGGFYNPSLFGTELRMTDHVKYLRVIRDKKFDWKVYLEKSGVSCILAVSRRAVGKTWDYH